MQPQGVEKPPGSSILPSPITNHYYLLAFFAVPADIWSSIYAFERSIHENRLYHWWRHRNWTGYRM